MSLSQPMPSAPPRDHAPQPGWHRVIVASMALAALVAAWVSMVVISRTDPWYRNTDMNIHNMAEALAINWNIPPHGIDQPALPLKYLLALDYRLRHYAGVLPVWNLKKFGASADPLREMPALIQIGRVHSRVLVMLIILSAAWLAYSVTRDSNSTCLTIILLCGSSGLLFHGLLTRPELLCVGFGNVLSLACAWRATASTQTWRNHTWLLLAGLFGGLAALGKLPGVCYLAVNYGWCWLAALTRPVDAPHVGGGPGNFWNGLLPAAVAVAVLGLLWILQDYETDLHHVVAWRLRWAATLTGLAPLLALATGHHRAWRFALERVRELTFLGAGALATLPLSYLLLRAVMTEPKALEYLTGVLHVLVNPQPYLPVLLTTKPEDVGGQFLLFFKETPVLFVAAATATVGLCLMRRVAVRLKCFVALLLLAALGMTWLMSRRYFIAQYSIFPQVPLLLVLALSLPALCGKWRSEPSAPAGPSWFFPLVLTTLLVITLGVYLRLQPKYTGYQTDADLPVRDFTVTFLFDHDYHTTQYMKIMKDHYGDRENFRKVLDRYLADPANRR